MRDALRHLLYTFGSGNMALVDRERGAFYHGRVCLVRGCTLAPILHYPGFEVNDLVSDMIDKMIEESEIV